MFSKIRVVLLHTSHPGNIGAAARALKTMGLSRLYLVNPKSFPTSKEIALATNAEDVLDAAVVCSSLEEAVGDCEIVYGSGSESRLLELPLTTPKEAAEAVFTEHLDREVAFVFGRESIGMTNDEMQFCQQHIQIHGNPEFRSLNLAAAVQIVTYELYQSYLSKNFTQKKRQPPALANHAEMEGFFNHMRDTMESVGFYDPVKPYRMMSRIRRIFNESKLQKKEIDMLRGFLRKVDQSREKK